ncbi:hypothetical protein [Paracoccus sp. R86501]|uniref:hypothetical protein n=1 Tax=Paracoccus sp. R86501 TaxID=3101711 RepID=UPI0036701ECD
MSDIRNGYATGPMGEAPASWIDFAPALALLLAGIVALAVATLVASPVQGQYLVLAPGAGGGQLTDLVYRAGGGVVGLGGLPGIAIAASDDPDFRSAMKAQGAWAVLPSSRLLGCFTDDRGVRP